MCYPRIVRTTVELKPEHRAALIAIAAQRGQKGFSAVLEEIIAAYLHGEQDRQHRRRTLESLAGSITAEEARELRDKTREIRESWR